MRLREACNFVLITKVVTSNKMYSYFHLATDDKDIIFFVNKVSMFYSGGPPSHRCQPQSPLLLDRPCCRSTTTLNLHTRRRRLQRRHLSSSTSSSSDATPSPLLVPVSNGPPPILLSPKQHRRGEEDPIHPPLSYFLLIVVFVAVKEIIVFDTSLPSHLSMCLST